MKTKDKAGATAVTPLLRNSVRPERGLASLLNRLGSIALGYRQARQAIGVSVHAEEHAASVQGRSVEPARAREMAAEMIGHLRTAATALCAPDGIDLTLTIVDGIHAKGAGAPVSNPDWETALATTLRKLRQAVAADIPLFDFDAIFRGADGYRNEQRRFEGILDDLLRDISTKQTDLESVALPELKDADGAERTTGPGASEDRKLKGQHCWRRAWGSYKHAIEQCPGLETDREVYAWLEENGCEEYGDGKDRERKRIPSEGTWIDYIIKMRGLLNENKNVPRRGRTGRSIVRQSEI